MADSVFRVLRNSTFTINFRTFVGYYKTTLILKSNISHFAFPTGVTVWLLLLFACFSSLEICAQESSNSTPPDSFFTENASTLSDSIPNVTDSISQPPKASAIDAEINYTSKDSLIFLGNGTAFLHGEADVTYTNINLKSEYVRVKMDSSLIYARGVMDTVENEMIGEPIFKDGDEEYEMKELTYNLTTRKGYIKGAITQQGEGYVVSQKTKKTADDVLCMADGVYTTCEQHDHPHFYLQLTKAKVNPGKSIVAGPAYLVVADVPLPLAIPFGFFPFNDSYSSGILMPSYGDDMTRGFSLTNGGYYFAINDYFDLEMTGDIYTKGTWALNLRSGYVKRYKYRGNLSVSYRNDVTGEKGLSNYSSSNNTSIQWSHSQDAKANPYSSFSASVNYSTSGYNRSNIDSYYRPELNSENTKSSSISYSRRFPDSPWNLSSSMQINQRTKDSTLSLTLPNLSISMSRIYPLKRKKPIGKERWYEKISMSYTGNISNSITSKENEILQKSFVNDWKNGVKNSIPISASFNLLKYINISPSINYNSRFYFKEINQTWNEHENQVQRDTTNGFYHVYDFNAGVSASTKLYGFYMPIRKIFGDKIDRIRHVVTPSVSFNWMPDFGTPTFGYYGNYDKKTINSAGDTIVNNMTYSRYDGALYGTPGRGKTGSIGFSLGNNVEMKLRNDKDTTGNKPFTIVSLIDNFSISGGYNLAADSMRWSNFNTNLRIKIGTYSLSLGGAFDPYMYALNSSGRPVRVNKLRWNNGKIPRFLGTSTSYSYTLNNDTFKKWFGKDGDKKDDSKPANGDENPPHDSNMPPDRNHDSDEHNNNDSRSESDAMDTDGYLAAEVPWSLSISYSLRWGQGREFDYDIMEYNREFTHNLSLSGNIGLGKGWKVSSSTSYDFKAKKLASATFNVTRDLHCWSMSGSFVPFGPYKSYNFHIGVNASMLSDLKYDKQSEYGGETINWW